MLFPGCRFGLNGKDLRHAPDQFHRQISLAGRSPPYIYGTTRLGDNQIPFDDRVRMARVAMDAGIWFHTSHTYGNALEVLRAAFDQNRAKVPELISKSSEAL